MTHEPRSGQRKCQRRRIAAGCRQLGWVHGTGRRTLDIGTGQGTLDMTRRGCVGLTGL